VKNQSFLLSLEIFMSNKSRRKKRNQNDAGSQFGNGSEDLDQIKHRKSLGQLRKANKTKPRSPDVTGKLRLQRQTLRAIVSDFQDSGGEEVICNIAGWKNEDQQKGYLTVEISPRFVPHEQRTPKPSIFDDMFDDEGE
jgi:hypothetical protein